MKKLSLLKIVSLIFIFAMLVGAVALTTVAADEQEPVKFLKNIEYGEKIQLMFAIPQSISEDATITAVSEGKELTVLRATDKDGDVSGYRAYIIAEGWAAHNIDTMVTVTVTDGENVYKLDYSVLMYTYEIININTSVEQRVKDFCQSLLSFAKSADIYFNKTETSKLDAYYYVSVVDGTIDGYNTWGMFKEGDKPFADIASTLECGANESIEWAVTVNGVTVNYKAADMADVEITGDTTVVANKVQKACEHNYEVVKVVAPDCENGGYTEYKCSYCNDGKIADETEKLGHEWNDATCAEPKTCGTCGETEGEALGHDWIDATCKAPKTCDTCGETEGEALGHTTENGICENCGFKITTVSEWQLVTNAANLSIGDKIIIVSKESNYAISTEDRGNNRGQAEVTKNSNTVTFGDNVQIIVLEAGTTDGTFAFNVGSGYLYAASSSGNQLKTKATLDVNGSWKIEIGSDTVATIKAPGSSNRNWLRYNSSNNPPIFSCYSSGQADVVVYKLVEEYSESCGHPEVINKETQQATCTEDGYVRGTCANPECNEVVIVEVLPATDHLYDIVLEAVEPTCKTPGLTEGVQCSVCKAITTEQIEIPVDPTAHKVTSGTICDLCGEDTESDQSKAENALAGITITGVTNNVTAAGTITLPTDVDGAAIAWEIVTAQTTNTKVTLDNNVLNVDLDNDATVIKLVATITVTVGEATASKTQEFTINVAKGAKDPVVVLEITKADFNSTSYAANNNTKTKNGYSYTTNQIMLQSSAMQWKKNEGYITIASNDFVKLELKSTAGTYTVTVGGKTVTGTTSDGITTYDLTGLTGQVKISVGNATGKTDFLKFYK